MTPQLCRARWAHRLIVAPLLVLALPLSPALGQGLGDAAARERAKRGKQGGQGPTFSNDDLERGKPKDSGKKKEGEEEGKPAPPPTSPDLEPAPPPAAPATPDPPDIAGIEAKIKEVQDKLNPMSSNYVHGAFGSLDPNEEARLRSELSRLQAELAKAQEELAKTPPAARKTPPPE